MSNVGSTIAKVAALAGGALFGAFLANLVDKFISSQAQERPDYEKSRYAQGLTPVAAPLTAPAPEPQTPIEEHPQQ